MLGLARPRRLKSRASVQLERRPACAGEDWVSHLPKLIDAVCEEWHLSLDDERIAAGAWGVVAWCHTESGLEAALKLCANEQRLSAETNAMLGWVPGGLAIVDLKRRTLSSTIDMKQTPGGIALVGKTIVAPLPNVGSVELVPVDGPKTTPKLVATGPLPSTVTAGTGSIAYVATARCPNAARSWSPGWPAA